MQRNRNISKNILAIAKDLVPGSNKKTSSCLHEQDLPRGRREFDNAHATVLFNCRAKGPIEKHGDTGRKSGPCFMWLAIL